MQVHHFSTPTTPAGAGSDVVISAAVQVKEEHAFQEAAALGEAPVINIRVDDAAAAYDFPGLKRWYVVEDEAPSGDQLIWTGYINDQEIDRGSSGTLFPRGAGRQWDLQLEEVNSILGFRVITGEDGDRPAETAGERLTWLLSGSDYLTTVGDNGLVVYPDDDMDANDYRGQTAQDVLSDIAVQVGYLFFCFYDKDADEDQRISLFFDDPDSLSYPADITSISNYGDANGTTIFAPWEEAKLRRSPSRVAAGVYLPYAGGAVYEYDLDTSYAFGFRDRVAPMASVKTEAKATALALQFLADNNEQDDRIFCRITMRAQDLNLIKRGQHVPARFQHFEGYEALQNFRVVRKTWQPPENRSQKWYDVDLELSPMVGIPTGAFAHYEPGSSSQATPILPTPTTPGNTLLLVVTLQNNAAGAPLPVTPSFNLDPVISPPWIGTSDLTWTEVGFAVGASFDGATHCAYGIYTRPVNPGEVTVTPMSVGPLPVANFWIGAWLWELPGIHVPTDVTTVTSDGIGFIEEGDEITVGAALSGFVVGGFCIDLNDYGTRAIINPTSGETVESATSLNTQNAPTPVAGMHPPWTWIATLTGGGQLIASYEQPYDSFPTRAVAGVACVIPGIRSLPHINSSTEVPFNVTP